MMRSMTRTLEAIYENGVLRPLEPLSLQENQQVTLTVKAPSDDPMDDVVEDDGDLFWDAKDQDSPVPTLEEVRRIMSRLPGKLSDDVIAERERARY